MASVVRIAVTLTKLMIILTRVAQIQTRQICVSNLGTIVLCFVCNLLSYGDCLEVKREYYQNCSVLGCVTQCSQSAAHSYEQFLQVQQIGFVTLGPLRHA